MVMEAKDKKRLVWSLVAFGVIMIGVIFNNSKKGGEPINPLVDPAKRVQTAEKPKPVVVDTAKIIENLHKEIAEMKAYIKEKKEYPEAITYINMVDGFKKKYDAYKYGGTAYQKFIPEYEKAVRAFAAYAFPKARMAYYNQIEHELWKQDIKVSLSGAGKTTLNITGALFAANKNIEDFHLSVASMLESYKFKRVAYRWYDGQSEYTYYDLSPKADNEL
jgi:hypothetical protein